MKNNHHLKFRSTIYGSIAAMFSDPNSKKFSLLLDELFQQEISHACHGIDKDAGDGKTALTDLFNQVKNHLRKNDRVSLATESVQLFGHTLSKKLAPYELEHLGNEDVFFRTQKLADLNGFYQAFGLEVNRIERADHIATQSEFISFLLIKEAMALSADSKPENADVCHDAWVAFLEDHFIDWGEIFSRNLSRAAPRGFYVHVGQFLKAFLAEERQLLPRKATAKP